MHYYQHHIGDFIKDTANLNDHQLATYLRMIWAYYTDEKCFTDDCGGIAFAVRSDEETVRRLLAHYFVQTPDGWEHPRCEREIGLYREKAEKARNSANARWKNANAMRTHSERNANERFLDANQEPRTKNQERAKAPPVSPKGEKSSKPEKPTKVSLSAGEMVDALPGLSLPTAEEFRAYRKGKKAPITEGAWKIIIREVAKAGRQPDEVLNIVMARGWVGFEAEWISNSQGQRGGQRPFNKQEAIEANNQRVVDEMIRREQERLSGAKQDEFNLGDAIVIEGEVLSAH